MAKTPKRSNKGEAVAPPLETIPPLSPEQVQDVCAEVAALRKRLAEAEKEIAALKAAQKQARSRKLLSRKELLDILPGDMTYPSAWTLIKNGILPEAVEIGGRIGWWSDELYSKLDKLKRRTPKGTKGAGDED